MRQSYYARHGGRVRGVGNRFTQGHCPKGWSTPQGSFGLCMGRRNFLPPKIGANRFHTATATIHGYDIGNNYEDEVHYAPEIVAHGEVGIVAVRVKNVDRMMLSVACDFRSSTRNSDEPSFTLTPETQQITSLTVNAMFFVWRGLGLSLRYTNVVEGKRALLLGTVFGGVFASF